MFQTNINPDLFCGEMLGFRNIYFTDKGSMPLTRLVLFNGKCFNFSFKCSMEYDGYASDFTDFEPSFIEKFKSRLWICDAMNFTFKSRKAFLLTRWVFYTAKEILHRFVNPLRHILSNLRMNGAVSTHKELIKIIFEKPMVKSG